MIDIMKLKPHTVSRGLEKKCVHLYGPPGTRKTTIACGFPAPLLLAVDVGYAYIPGVHAVNIDSWATFKVVIRQLMLDQAKNKYSTVIIDGFGLLAEMCESYILQINDNAASLGDIAWGRGWSGYMKEFTSNINKIPQNDYGLVKISHADIKEDKDGNVISIKPKLSKQAAAVADGLSDFTFFCQKGLNENEEVTVFAYCETDGSISSKSRLRYISPKFEFTYNNLVAEVSAAVEKLENSTSTVATDEVINIRKEANKLPFEDLKACVKNLATILIADQNHPLFAESYELISSILRGTPISQTTVAHYEKLELLLSALEDLQYNSER